MEREFGKSEINLKIVSYMCLAGAMVTFWSLTQEVAGSNSFSVTANICSH